MYWTFHRIRLTWQARVLGISLDLDALESRLLQAIASMDDTVCRVAVYMDGTVNFSFRGLPSRKSDWAWGVLQRDCVQNASIKWVDRRDWDVEKDAQKVDLLLLHSDTGAPLEWCIGNLFVYRPRLGQWLTPPLNAAILPGIMRVIALQFFKEQGVAVREEPFLLEGDDELWLSNVVRGFILVHANKPPHQTDMSIFATQEFKCLEAFEQSLEGLFLSN